MVADREDRVRMASLSKCSFEVVSNWLCKEEGRLKCNVKEEDVIRFVDGCGKQQIREWQNQRRRSRKVRSVQG